MTGGSYIEKLLASIDSGEILEPKENSSRVELQLMRLAGNEDVDVPRPLSRVEALLESIYLNGGLGGSQEPPTDYMGVYEFTSASNEDLTLETKNKIMADNIVIDQIPYYSSSNLSGGNTAYIGAETQVQTFTSGGSTGSSGGTIDLSMIQKYPGPYEGRSIPRTDQTFETKDKLMTKNFKIKQVYTNKVTTPGKGTTMIIGSEG